MRGELDPSAATARVAAKTRKPVVKVNTISVCDCRILRLRPKEGAVGEVSTERECTRSEGQKKVGGFRVSEGYLSDAAFQHCEEY